MELYNQGIFSAHLSFCHKIIYKVNYCTFFLGVVLVDVITHLVFVICKQHTWLHLVITPSLVLVISVVFIYLSCVLSACCFTVVTLLKNLAEILNLPPVSLHFGSNQESLSHSNTTPQSSMLNSDVFPLIIIKWLIGEARLSSWSYYPKLLGTYNCFFKGDMSCKIQFVIR